MIYYQSTVVVLVVKNTSIADKQNGKTQQLISFISLLMEDKSVFVDCSETNKELFKLIIFLEADIAFLVSTL